MDALKNISLGSTSDGDDAFEPVEIGALGAEEVGDPGVEFFGVEFAWGGDTDRGDFVVVLMIIVFVIVFVMLMSFEETGFEGEGAAKVEAAEVKHAVQGQVGVGGAVNGGEGVDLADTAFDRFEFGGGNKVGFVEDEDIGEGELFTDFVLGIKVEGEVFGVDHGDDSIHLEFFLESVVDKEGLDDGTGIGQAGCFDEDAVEAVFSFEEGAEDADQVAADGAADAAVVHFEDFLVGTDDQLMVYTDFAEFVFDHSDAMAVVLTQNAVEKSGFAGTEEAGEDGDGDAIVGSLGSGHTEMCSVEPALASRVGEGLPTPIPGFGGVAFPVEVGGFGRFVGGHCVAVDFRGQKRDEAIDEFAGEVVAIGIGGKKDAALVEAAFAGAALGGTGQFGGTLDDVELDRFLEAGVALGLDRAFGKVSGPAAGGKGVGDGPVDNAVTFLGTGQVEGMFAGDNNRVGEIAGVIDETAAGKPANEGTPGGNVMEGVEVADGDRGAVPAIEA